MKKPDVSVESLFNQWIACGGAVSAEELCRGLPGGMLADLRARIGAYERSGGSVPALSEVGASGRGGAVSLPLGESGASMDAATLAPVGMGIGRYTIVRFIGEGGMGAVYEALQEAPKRSVALKLIRPGLLTPAMLRRFEREAEVLGRLQDPGIAQIYEAGSAPTPYGPQPFLAMELVLGEPLTKYADLHRLDARQRLAMVARVAESVHHAHQRGVIHRDLKPGNILVTGGGAGGGVGGGQPKILDFGLAKSTDAEVVASAQTELGVLMGTLPYMAPEQTESSEGMDTRTDVYALGVIAYELLTRRRPLEVSGKSVPESLRMIREQEPQSLSAIHRELRGDVETIVRKAMAKEKGRRYESAHALAEDIGRFLNDEPIAARPASTWYQLGKFARRNRMLVGGVLTVFAVLAAGFVGTTAGFVGQRMLRLEAERARGEAEAARAREAAALAVANRERAAAEAALAQIKASRERELAAASDKAKAEAEARLQRGAATRAQAAERTALSALDEEVKRRAEMEAARNAADEAAARQALSAGMQVYAINIRAADAAVAAGDLAGARKMLDLCPPALRGWEWNYLDTQAGKPPLVLAATPSRPTSVAFSADGLRLAVGYADARVRVCEAETGKEIMTLAGHTAMVHAVSFSPQGKQVVTAAGTVGGGSGPGGGGGGVDCTARVWDAGTGRELLVLRGHTGRVRSACFSPDGSKVLTGSEDGTARVWDAATGRQVLIIVCASPVRQAVFSTRGTRIATANEAPDRAVQVWNAASGGNLGMLNAGAAATAVSFSPEVAGLDSGRVIAGFEDGKARAWEVGTQRTYDLFVPQVLPEMPAGVMAASFGATERHLVLAMGDGSVRVFEGARQVSELRAPGDAGEALLAAVGGGGIGAAVFAPDDRRVAGVSADGRVRVWPTIFGDNVLEFKETTSAAFSPDGRRLATVSELDGTRSPMIRDAATGRLERRLLGRDVGGIRGVAYSGNGRRVVGWGPAGQGAIVSAWEAESGRQVALFRLRHGVTEDAVTISADGGLIYTGGEGALAWDVAGGRVSRTFGHAADRVSAVELSPDGRMLATATVGSVPAIHLWNATTGELLYNLMGHGRAVGSLTFTRDGRRLFSRGEDGVMIIWDAATGDRVRTLPEAVYRGKAAFSPDGARLTAIVSSGANPRVAFCDVETGVELSAIRLPAAAIGWSPDGSRFMIGNGSAVKIWDSRVSSRGKAAVEAGSAATGGVGK